MSDLEPRVQAFLKDKAHHGSEAHTLMRELFQAYQREQNRAREACIARDYVLETLSDIAVVESFVNKVRRRLGEHQKKSSALG